MSIADRAELSRRLIGQRDWDICETSLGTPRCTSECSCFFPLPSEEDCVSGSISQPNNQEVPQPRAFQPDDQWMSH